MEMAGRFMVQVPVASSLLGAITSGVSRGLPAPGRGRVRSQPDKEAAWWQRPIVQADDLGYDTDGSGSGRLPGSRRSIDGDWAWIRAEDSARTIDRPFAG